VSNRRPGPGAGPGGEGAADYPDHGEPPVRSALRFPPCRCPDPECVLKQPDRGERERAQSDSPLLADLRVRVHEDNERRRHFRQLGCDS
jgi:hypothetical protein